jgi:hypothetical protein
MKEFRIMQRSILLSIAGGAALGAASGASAQAGGPPGGTPTGGVRSQDVAAANHQIDSDYNTLAGRGVKVTNQDRANMPKPQAKPGSIVPATAADIKAGAQVRDIKGVPLGTIATLASNEVVADPSQAVIDTGQTKIGVPLNAFGKDSQGLLLSITAEKFNQLVAQAHAKAQQSN